MANVFRNGESGRIKVRLDSGAIVEGPYPSLGYVALDKGIPGSRKASRDEIRMAHLLAEFDRRGIVLPEPVKVETLYLEPPIRASIQ